MDRAVLFATQPAQAYDFAEVLHEVQEYLSGKYALLMAQDPAGQKQQITAYIAKYLSDHGLSVAGMGFDALVERLYTEMAEFSFLTQYLFNNQVEEVNINSWNDIKVIYADGRVEPAREKFTSPQHAVDVVRRMLHQSGIILDHSQPVVRGHLSNKIRITCFGNPVTDREKGLAASIRIINPQKLSRADFIQGGTATPQMLDFLSTALRYGVSMCVTGATGSGKTTLMSWILSTIPDEKRIVTIENGCREFDLVKYDERGNAINNVIHLTTRYSDDPQMVIDQEKLLEYSLTANPDVICMGEAKSAEAMAVQEAANTGHSVITTIHANSCAATYNRLVTLCRQKYVMDERTLYHLVTEAFPLVLFVKRLEDNSRKIMEITECEALDDGSRKLRTLYRYQVAANEVIGGKLHIRGQFVKVNELSGALQKRLLENGLPIGRLQELLQGGAVI